VARQPERVAVGIARDRGCEQWSAFTECADREVWLSACWQRLPELDLAERAQRRIQRHLLELPCRQAAVHG
jgi:hypothetical protein